DPIAGHIPGAVNRPHLDNLDASGRHRPLAELAARFEGLGPAPVVYCGSGVTACHDLLAMAVVGIDDARLYPGSWSEWSGDPSRPFATGAEP
ncbi:MAG TPA: rhodanese-like domain-containing protein, partial [Ilumatobacteraceae bacterium]